MPSAFFCASKISGSVSVRIALPSDLWSNWQLEGGHFSQKRKFCALLAISNHRRDLFIIQCTDKPHLVCSVGSRRKTTINLSVGCHYFFFSAHLAQPVQLGCTADFEQFWPILGPKNSIEYRASWYWISPSMLSKYRATVARPCELG